MDRDQDYELQILRRAYAKQVLWAANVSDPLIEEAFANVPREHYVGDGPWPIMHSPGVYMPSPSDDPAYLYTDHLVGIITTRQINNGQPSLHAGLISNAAPKRGEHVVHVGAGVGYYTAILAHIVGSAGRVTAFEFDPQLAARARVNLAALPNVRVVHADATTARFEPADVIYVNCGLSHIPLAWIDGLAEGGRLLVPMTTGVGFDAFNSGKLDFAKIAKLAAANAVLRIHRTGDEFHVRHVCAAIFIPAESASSDPVKEAAAKAALAAAFDKGGAQRVTRLYRKEEIPEARCWLRGAGWCLAYD